ncbi:serine protease [Microcoleus sp. AT9_B5]
MQLPQNRSFQRLLQESTLRLNSQYDYGTGFFVAPGFVLTCKHVIGKSDIGSCIKANWSDRELTAKVVSFLENDDIALLSVDLVNHPCVFLDKQEVEIGQRLYTYGYPHKERDGDSRSPESEGLSNKYRLLTLKGANIQSGFSGSPIVNIKTEKVCAMTTTDRKLPIPGTDVKEILGGQAIPAEIIISFWSKLIGNTISVEIILSMRTLGVLGIFADCIKQEENFFYPWSIHTNNPLPTQDLRQVILKWARKVHFSFLGGLDMKTVELALSNIHERANLDYQELYNYFSIPRSDLRLQIVSKFAEANYKARAPFEHCVYQFLFICTNKHIFIDMINTETIQKKFIEYAKKFIIAELSSIYVNEKQLI